MPDGFFTESELLAVKAPPSLVPLCGACGLFRHCKSPKMPCAGEGRRGILIVGAGPDKSEDFQNEQFVGKAGKHLEKILRRVGLEMRRDCWLYNAIICCAKDSDGNSRAPTNLEIDYCRPNVTNLINALKPKVIILLGDPAVQSVIASLWKGDESDIGSIARWAGWLIPCQSINAWVCPSYHPGYCMKAAEDDGNELPNMFLEQHLQAAVEKTKRPWQSIPDYARMVTRYMNPDEAIEQIQLFNTFGNTVAIDFETNCLKPEYPGAEIVCCSISDGKTTIAFPWHGQVIREVGGLLLSKTPKIGASDLEDRWTRFIYGKGINNLWYDTLIGSHCLDNRGKITSVKFQSFALLGVASYNDHISPFLKSQEGTRLNRILESIDMGQLLTYCGIDSLTEYCIAALQHRSLSRKPMREDDPIATYSPFEVVYETSDKVSI